MLYASKIINRRQVGIESEYSKIYRKHAYERTNICMRIFFSLLLYEESRFQENIEIEFSFVPERI